MADQLGGQSESLIGNRLAPRHLQLSSKEGIKGQHSISPEARSCASFSSAMHQEASSLLFVHLVDEFGTYPEMVLQRHKTH